MFPLLRRRLLSSVSKRREIFQFGPLEYDTKVTVHTDTSENVEIPLEAHSIGSYGPSLIPFDEGLLADLACPISGHGLKFDKEHNVLVSEAAGVAFPINKAGIPLFLKKWAIPLENLKKD